MYPITSYATPDGSVLPHVHDGTTWRALGAMPTPQAVLARLPRFADYHPILPRSQWKPISFAGYPVRMMNQGQHGSCVGHGAAGAIEKARQVAGCTPYELSPCFVYALGNGGRDAGMVISDAADILTQTGICLESEVPEGRIWKRDIPQSAYATAKRFRLLKFYHAKSFDEVATGLQLGFIPFYGYYVGSDINNLDREGVIPVHRGAMGNHCNYGDGLTLLPSGRWAIENINSWGSQWGMPDRPGCCRLVEGHYNSYCDAILIQAVAEDPQETNLPPKAA